MIGQKAETATDVFQWVYEKGEGGVGWDTPEGSTTFEYEMIYGNLSCVSSSIEIDDELLNILATPESAVAFFLSHLESLTLDHGYRHVTFSTIKKEIESLLIED